MHIVTPDAPSRVGPASRRVWTRWRDGGGGQLAQKVLHRQIDPDQIWFWTPEWQHKEREVDERLARGERGMVQQSGEEFLAALDARIQQLDT